MAARRLFIRLDETPSTNSALRAAVADNPALAGGSVLCTRRQTAGRGQRGNCWEAEPGMNVTMSMLLRPVGVKARDQFIVSECVALGVARVVVRHLPPGLAAKVKWPNDIYVGDGKICGILIENSLLGGYIGHTIAGIGLNVNQRVFRSDAPNPVSIAQFSGKKNDVDSLVAEIADEIDLMMTLPPAMVHAEYLSSLWRGRGFYRYITPGGEVFRAEIAGVGLDGILSLRDMAGVVRRFAFKEVAALIG